MKAIKLMYNKNDVELSLHFISFFRMIGVYAYEGFWGSRDIEILEDIHKNAIDEYDNYDCFLCILKEEEDRAELQAFMENVDVDKVICFSPFEQVGRCRTIATDADPQENLIHFLEMAEEQSVITPDEGAEFREICKVAYKHDYVRQYFLLKYFYRLDAKSSEDIKEHIQDVLNELMQILKRKECAWGTPGMLHMQLACVKLIYDINMFSKKIDENISYDSETLLSICREIDESSEEQLGNSVKVLMGNIYHDLLAEPNRAYECYIAGCNEKYRYDSYVYFMKALYWQIDAEEIENAIKYFSTALSIYPEYYRAWYRLGMCYQGRAEYDEALDCYENVERCLSGRLEAQKLRPLEFDYLVKSNLQMTNIRTKCREYKRALENALRAEKIFNAIDSSVFYDIILDPEDLEKYRSLTKENLPKNYILDMISMLYEITGEFDKAKQYRAMRNKV